MQSRLAELAASVAEEQGFGTTPPGSKASDRPDLHRGLGFIRRLARKGREIAPGYVGWDDGKVILLGRSPLAEADSGPSMTSGPDPHGSSMATPRNAWLCQARRVGEAMA